MSTISGARGVSLAIIVSALGTARSGQAARAITVQINQEQQEAFSGVYYDHGGPISLRECLLRTGFERERQTANLRVYRGPAGQRWARLSGPVTLHVQEWGEMATSDLQLVHDPGSSGYWRLPETEITRLAPPPTAEAGPAGAGQDPTPHWPLLGAGGVLLIASLTWRVRQRRGAPST